MAIRGQAMFMLTPMNRMILIVFINLLAGIKRNHSRKHSSGASKDN